jgi:hypothetical protein
MMGMGVQKPTMILLWVGLCILSAACNQLDTVLPSAGTYQVNALVNQFSLDECSVIATGDTVLPYFSSPVAGDPDLAGLVVYLEDSEGVVLGNHVRYTMKPGAGSLPDGGPQSGGEDGEPEADNLFEDEAASPVAADPVPAYSYSRGGLDPTKEKIILVSGFTGKLPSFPIPEELKIGSYTLVFEIRGEQDLLSRISRPVYYIGDQEFAVGDIQCYLPGFYGSGNLAPPGLTVMLETRLSFSEGLDPYIVWYNGDQRIGEGPAAEGAARMLWKTPQKSGFHTIRAELFPFRPQKNQKGKIRELSLPISPGNEAVGAPSAADENFLYWYQFAGNLLDTRGGAALDQIHGDKAELPWRPAKQIYGLALERGEGYEAPRMPLKLTETGEGNLRLTVRFFPLKEGPIVTARLGTVHLVTITLALAEETLTLSLEEGDQQSQIGRSLAAGGTGPSVVEAVIDVEFRNTTICASLELGGPPFSAAARQADEPNKPSGDKKKDLAAASPQPPEEPLFPKEQAVLSLSEALNGELRSWLGDSEKVVAPPEAGNTGDTPQASDSGTFIAVVDDFAALFYLPSSSPGQEIELSGQEDGEKEKNLAGLPDSAEQLTEALDPTETSGKTGRTEILATKNNLPY